MFDLVQELKGCDFKTAVSYLQDSLGISRESYLFGIENDRTMGKYARYEANKESTQEGEQKVIEKEKELKLEGLIARSRGIGVSNGIRLSYQSL
jgi:hypothetical protein